MSGPDAVSATTKTLIALLRKHMDAPPATIYGAPPDVRLGDPPSTKRLNVFLYRVEENRFLKNQDLDARPGRRGNPPLSLDLHYLLTAYGSSDEDAAGAQEILGDAVRVLHDHPLIHADDDHYDDVRDPALDGAFEAVKITMEPVTTEDLTKVWTALTTPYRLSAAYVVNVVQIESHHRPRPAPLVRDGSRPPGSLSDAGTPGSEGRRIVVTALEPPGLDAAMVLRDGEDDEDAPHVGYAAIGDRIVLRGRNFGRPPAEGSTNPTTVHIGPLTLSPTPDRHRPDRLLLPLPDDPELAPGQYPVHVAVSLGGGRILTSNRLPLLVVPYVEKAEKKTMQAPAPDADPDDADPPREATNTVLITGKRLFADGLPGRVILSRDGTTIDVHDGAYLRKVDDPDYTQPSDTKIAIRVPDGIDAADMRVRVLVDGHENLPRPDLVVQEGA